MFPLQTEGKHTANFILSEATGNRSRANALFVDPATVYVGAPVKKVAATSDIPEHWTVVADNDQSVGADCEALAIYGGVTSSGYDIKLAILVRDAEVNGNLVRWPVGMVQGEITAAIAKLATAGIIVRY